MMHNYIAGQGQTDMRLNQRTGVVALERGLSCAKSDNNSSLHPPPSSPQTTSLQKRERLVQYYFFYIGAHYLNANIHIFMHACTQLPWLRIFWSYTVSVSAFSPGVNKWTLLI